MKAKVILVTGSTDGIGRQTAIDLAKIGHKVIVHGRNQERSLDAAKEIKSRSGSNDIETVVADFTDLESIKAMAQDVKKRFSQLDVLVNNAGVFENKRVMLENGFERTFMVNHLAMFALTLQLLDLIQETPGSRIVNVSSMAQSGSIDFDNLNGEKYFDSYNAYAVSKLENVLFTYKMVRILNKKDITVNCLHPGVIKTKLFHAGWGIGGNSLERGAQTPVFAAVSPEMEKKTGLYLVNEKEMRSSAISYDRKIQDRLWDLSLSYTGLQVP
ncbi:MAG: SDR family oxidoreductase [Bacteroidales bacterium]|nr:SDR family oxidoreductase [Bacteroidales bacterium]